MGIIAIGGTSYQKQNKTCLFLHYFLWPLKPLAHMYISHMGSLGLHLLELFI